jgi:hypothetical protein
VREKEKKKKNTQVSHFIIIDIMFAKKSGAIIA